MSPEDEIVLKKIDDEELLEEVLAVLDDDVTIEDLNELISDDGFEDLDSGALKIISEALSDAPTEVKEEFESQVNVFSGGFDNYVPTGSKIDIGDRRVVVAVTVVTAAVAAPVASTGGGDSSGNGSRRKRK